MLNPESLSVGVSESEDRSELDSLRDMERCIRDGGRPVSEGTRLNCSMLVKEMANIHTRFFKTESDIF